MIKKIILIALFWLPMQVFAQEYTYLYTDSLIYILDTDASSTDTLAIINMGTLTDNFVLTYDAATNQWKAEAAITSANATTIRGVKVTQIAPADNQILKFDSVSDSLKYESDTGAGSGAPDDATYITTVFDGDLQAERVLTGTSNQITLTDGGANSTMTLSLPQNYHTTASPQLARLGFGTPASSAAEIIIVADGDTLRFDMGTILNVVDIEVGNIKVFQVDSTGIVFSNALTASRLVSTDASQKMVSTITEANFESSVSDATNFIVETEIDTYSELNTIVTDQTLTNNSLIDTYSELNTIVADVTLTHNGLINTYAELNTIVADVTLTHNGLIDTYSEINVIVADKTLVNAEDNFNISGIYEILDDVDFRFGSDADWTFNYDESVDNQLLLSTTNTSAVATTDPMFEILVGTTPTADQQVFGVAKGTQATNTPLFTLDEDGDGVFAGDLDVAGNIIVSGTVDGKDIATNAAMLNETEVIASDWDNTANPWVDNEVSNTLTSSIFIGSGSTTNAIDLATAEAAGVLPDANIPDIEGLSTSLTSGSVVFSDGSNLTQDNANIFWDDTNNRLGIGTATPLEEFHVVGEIFLEHTAVEADEHALEIDVDAAGFGDIKGLVIDYDTGAISTGEIAAVLLIDINEIDAVGGDVIGLEILSTDGGADNVVGIKVGAEIAPLIQDSGTFINPTLGTNNTNTTNVPDMIDGSTGTNTTIFAADNDFIIMGANAANTQLEFVIETGFGGPGIQPVFAFSTTGTNQFTNFAPTDGTNGFKSAGAFVVAWDVDEVPGYVADDVTGKFDIRVTRTANPSGSVSLFYGKSAATRTFEIDKDGNVRFLTYIFEGATDDANELTLNVIDPTADRLFNFPDDQLVAGDVLVASDASDLEYLNLATTEILIGDGAGIPTAAALSGGATMDNAGVVTIVTNANLTGHVTSTGNATLLGSFTEAQLETAVSDDNPLFDGDIGGSVQGILTNSAGLAGALSDETGSGLSVFATSPTFTTGITVPLVIGGTATTSDLNFKTTTGLGEAGADMHFGVGNDGGTEAMTILNNGDIGVGTTSPAYDLQVESTTADATIAITADNASVSRLLLGDEDDATKAQILYHHAKDSMQFIVNGAAAMTIISDGNIAIGGDRPLRPLHFFGPDGPVTTFPTNVGAKDVFLFENNDNASMGFIFATGKGVAIKWYEEGGSNHEAGITYNGGNEILSIGTVDGLGSGLADEINITRIGGHIGFGTTTPYFKFHIDNEIRTDSTGMWFENDSTITTDGSAKTIFTISTVTDMSYRLTAEVIGNQDDGSNTMGATWKATVKNSAGTVSEIGETILNEHDDSAGVTISGVVSSTNYLIQVTGIVSENWIWEIAVEGVSTKH